ncbi:hypothetical protein ANO11243_016420 [Dothideomycetidae sp. 11243]|nr:hypothetical protein ANO11243_016420 [fungal sp. No.11243]
MLVIICTSPHQSESGSRRSSKASRSDVSTFDGTGLLAATAAEAAADLAIHSSSRFAACKDAAVKSWNNHARQCYVDKGSCPALCRRRLRTWLYGDSGTRGEQQLGSTTKGKARRNFLNLDQHGQRHHEFQCRRALPYSTIAPLPACCAPRLLPQISKLANRAPAGALVASCLARRRGYCFWHGASPPPPCSAGRLDRHERVQQTVRLIVSVCNGGAVGNTEVSPFTTALPLTFFTFEVFLLPFFGVVVAFVAAILVPVRPHLPVRHSPPTLLRLGSAAVGLSGLHRHRRLSF